MWTWLDAIPLWVYAKIHLGWHMALMGGSVVLSQNPKWAPYAPILQFYGQITPPPELPQGK